MKNITLLPLAQEDREQFILDNQKAFRFGAMEEFGLRDDHMEEDGEIISRATIEASINATDAVAYRIICDGESCGGMIVRLDALSHKGELDILFVNPSYHNRHIGQTAWFALEDMYPDIIKWTTYTPYFETRNIHFYVNCLGFHIVEFLHKGHQDPEGKYVAESDDEKMFKFEKWIIKRMPQDL